MAGPDKLTAMSKKWRSRHWKNWYKDLVLDMNETDIAEDLDRPECDERKEETASSSCEPLRSNAGSPPLADDDRRESPAEYLEDKQGGIPKTKTT